MTLVYAMVGIILINMILMKKFNITHQIIDYNILFTKEQSQEMKYIQVAAWGILLLTSMIIILNSMFQFLSNPLMIWFLTAGLLSVVTAYSNWKFNNSERIHIINICNGLVFVTLALFTGHI